MVNGLAHLKPSWLPVRFLGFDMIVPVLLDELFELCESHYGTTFKLRTFTNLESQIFNPTCNYIHYSISPAWKSFFNLKTFMLDKVNNLPPSKLSRHVNCSLLLSCLILSGDVEINPGPPVVGSNRSVVDVADEDAFSGDHDFSMTETVYLCGSCKEPVTWDQKGLLCEHPGCETWYHIDCQAVGDSTYYFLGRPDVSWTCTVCDGPNYSSTLFDLYDLERENRFASLADMSDCSGLSLDTLDSQDTNITRPKATSSPVKARPKPVVVHRPLRVLNVNSVSPSVARRDPSTISSIVLNLILSSLPRLGLIIVLLIASYLTHSLQCIVVIEIAMVVASLSQLTMTSSALVKSLWKTLMLSLFGLGLTSLAVIHFTLVDSTAQMLVTM